MARRTRSAELDAALQLDSEHAQATQFRLVQSSTYPQFYSNTAEHESSINRRLPELPYSHPSSDRPPSYHSDCSQNGTGNLITHCPPSSLIAVNAGMTTPRLQEESTDKYTPLSRWFGNQMNITTIRKKGIQASHNHTK
uniref:Uncharacterized protein n=1 Tax=Branchiostoma floridae TaxID=7739 RepID=C3YR96_BRAFL|eukprot:XP_002601081.1 hypothetical protein BRAFLDRAFT_121044 [Branchiostoma floridae]